MTEEKLLSFARSLAPEATLDSDLVDELDSLQIVEFLDGIEREFNVSIPSAQFILFPHLTIAIVARAIDNLVLDAKRRGPTPGE